MNVLRAPVTVLLSELKSDPSLLMAGALTTFVTVIVSVVSAGGRGAPSPDRGAPKRASIDGGPAGGIDVEAAGTGGWGTGDLG